VLLAVPAGAAQIDELEVHRHDDLYQVRLDAHVAAPQAAVWAALNDYPDLHRLSEAVSSSEDLGPDAAGRHLVHTLSHVCVWILCKDIEQVQRMRPEDGNRLEADTLPEHGDLAYGHMQWDLASEPGGTRLRFTAEVRPGFWVPPLLGPPMVSRGLRSYALDALRGLEREAGRRP
jgi:carbon monoxide dehydrogenase subunit G